MHLANGDINAEYSVLPEGEAAVDTTVAHMVEMAKGKWGRESPKIRAAAINIVNGMDPITGEAMGSSPVPNKDYFGMLEAIHNYVRDHIRYMKDPVGQETLSYPEETLFNSQAGDCDDMTILEIALLGSIGIVAYPVVIGLYPNHYSHVYLHADIPPGKHRYAGKTFAADPIMREWPLGRAAPADRVKAKKVYSNLAGIDSMLHGYASAPAALSPTDELEATQVPGVLKSRLTDTGHRGQIMNSTRLTEWGDELDEMFNAEATINPMQAAPASMLYARGPVVARQERVLTSYLQEAPLGGRRNQVSKRRGPMVVTITDKVPTAKPGAPTVGELMGLADYLGDLKVTAQHAGKRHTILGRGDAVHMGAAAAHYAKQRAKKASGRVVKLQNAGFMPGFGADMQPDKTMDAALAIEKLAHQIAAMAQDVAERCAGASPIRQKALNLDLNSLDYIDRYVGISDMVASVETPGVSLRDEAKIRAESLRELAQDDEVRRGAVAVSQPAPARGPRPSVRTPLPFSAVVRDPNGNIIQNGNAEDEDGLAAWNSNGKHHRRGDYQVAGLGSFFSKVKNKAQQVVHQVQNVVKTTVKDPKKLALAVATGGLTSAYSATKGAVSTISPKIARNFDNIARGVMTGGLSATVKGIQKAGQNVKNITGKKSSSAPAQQTSYVDANGNPLTEAQYNAIMAQQAADASAQQFSATDPAPGAGPDTFDPNSSGDSIVPQPGESSYDPSGDMTAMPTDSFGPDEMSAASSAPNSFVDESGGGFTDQVNVNDDFSAGEGDASSDDGGTSDQSGSDSSGDDDNESPGDDATVDESPAPRKRRSHRRRNSMYDDSSYDLDSSDDDGSDDVATSDAYADMDSNEDGGAGDDEGSAMEPGVEGFPAPSSILPLALGAAAIYLLFFRKK